MALITSGCVPFSHDPICEALLSAGADGEAADSSSANTPLHVAAQAGHASTCEVLIAAGAEMEAKNSGGGTPLQIAAENGHADACLVLQAADADPEVRDPTTWTILPKTWP